MPPAFDGNQRSHGAHGGLDLRVLFICSSRTYTLKSILHIVTFWRPNRQRQPDVLLYPTHGPFGLAGKGCSHTDVRTQVIHRALSFLLPGLVKKGQTAFIMRAYTQPLKHVLKFHDIHQSAFPLLTKVYL